MSDPLDKRTNAPMPSPTWKPSPPEMELEPIPLPDQSVGSSLDDSDQSPHDKGRVPPIPSRDEANISSDDALPEDSEEEILGDDPAREKTRFDEELPKSSR
ncbi:hypothetical protein ASC97_22530 [Rhizobium sp. Root1203]|nr:hypothetical protein ASC97_22530 [Rhizobium sp. Root1203]